MGRSVLIVDNAPNARELMRVNLEQNGYVVVGEAADTIEAVKLYQKEKPDLVTLDLFLNGESGFDTLKALRRIDPDARVVVITAIPDADRTMSQKAAALGAKALIDKGNDWNRIQQALSEASK